MSGKILVVGHGERERRTVREALAFALFHLYYPDHFAASKGRDRWRIVPKKEVVPDHIQEEAKRKAQEKRDRKNAKRLMK